MAKSFKGRLHAHGCARCGMRYEDACEEPATDTLCTGCRGGLVWQALIDSRLPRSCCREQARLVTKDEKLTYTLAGKRLWYICPACARTHPHPFTPNEKRPR